MANYTTASISRGAGADFAAALTQVGAADTFAPGADVMLRVKNSSGGAVTVTVIGASTVAGPRGTFLAPLALAPTVGATTGDRGYGPFPADTFADPADGLVHVTYSATTGVTAGTYRLAN